MRKHSKDLNKNFIIETKSIFYLKNWLSCDRINKRVLKLGVIMKRILILTVTAGNGHNACAKAMKEKLESEYGQVEVKIIDLLKTYSSAIKIWVADKGYSIAIGKFRHLYNMFYEYYLSRKPSQRYRCAAQGVAMSLVEGLYREINEFKPDVIYSTHFYGGIAISNLRLVYDIPCKVIVANLDYVNSPFWEASIGIDYFIIPNDDFIKPSLKIGYKESQLKSFGLPVNEKFYKEVDKSKARQELGLEKDIFTIMIMYGGGRWGGGFNIFKDVLSCFKDRKVQIIMINGHNEKDYERISKMKFKPNIKVLNVGFTNQVDLYMSASDIIINKLGGTSATEMINKKLPAIVTPVVSGQEKHNLKYLMKKGAVKTFKDKKELKKVIFDLMDNPKHYQEMVENISKLRVNGIDRLAKFIMDQPTAMYDQEKIDKIDYKQVTKNVIKAKRKAHRSEQINYKKELKHEKYCNCG